MTGQRGYSGASVLVGTGEAIKVGYERSDKIVAQGEWLADNAHEHLPTVYAIMPKGYAMEVLAPIPTPEVELDPMLDALERSCWRFAPQVHVNTPQTLLYVSRILDSFAPHLLDKVVERAAYIRRTEDCMTHGDPTAENVMLRGDTYVMIDPIPATCRVPSDLAADVGKILQSAHGWEEIKGEERALFTPDQVLAKFPHDVADVAQHWTIVHFVRTLPYCPTREVRDRVILKLEELLGVRR
jgi:hypothetical protein